MRKTALILDGSIAEDAVAAKATAVVKEWLSAHEWSAHVYVLRELTIAPCMGCFGCWIKTPGECVLDDAGRDIARRIVQSGLVVYLTPIQFGGYSYELKKALDRSIPIISPFFRRVKGEVHHKKRYARYPNVAAIGWSALAGEGDDEIFDALVQRNAINMHAKRAVSSTIRPGDPEGMCRRIEWTLGEVTHS
jgi:hypothetical protein